MSNTINTKSSKASILLPITQFVQFQAESSLENITTTEKFNIRILLGTKLHKMVLLLLEQFPKVNKYIKTQLKYFRKQFRKPNSNLPKREPTQAQNAMLESLVKS